MFNFGKLKVGISLVLFPASLSCYTQSCRQEGCNAGFPLSTVHFPAFLAAALGRDVEEVGVGLPFALPQVPTLL